MKNHNIKIDTVTLEWLKLIRNYFGENDRTPFEHAAFNVLDRIVNTGEAVKEKSADELDFTCEDADLESTDETKYCSCGEEIESENSSVCIDCFNEMTFND